MASYDNLFDSYARFYESQRDVEMSLEDYLSGCADDPMMYASASERLLKAIGDPVVTDTSQDARLGRIFMNRTIKVYPAFEDFYGMEETIKRIVGFFCHAAEGLEERKQILYLLGPVGGGKSSLAERLKALVEKFLKAGKDTSPRLESPLGLFNPEILSAQIGGVAKTEPGDENNQDISSLVGKVDIRKLEYLPQSDPDACAFLSSLSRTTQGMLGFVEMFKAPIKMLHPFLAQVMKRAAVSLDSLRLLAFRRSESAVNSKRRQRRAILYGHGPPGGPLALASCSG
jgi:serine protein kinase